jgi:hypothetical protein
MGDLRRVWLVPAAATAFVPARSDCIMSQRKCAQAKKWGLPLKDSQFRFAAFKATAKSGEIGKKHWQIHRTVIQWN